MFFIKDISADNMKDMIFKFVVKKHLPLDLLEDEDFFTIRKFSESNGHITYTQG